MTSVVEGGLGSWWGGPDLKEAATKGRKERGQKMAQGEMAEARG